MNKIKIFLTISIYKFIILLLFSILSLLLSNNFNSFANANDYSKPRFAKNTDLLSLSFNSTSIKVNEKPYNLASKNSIKLRFDEYTFTLNLGCNTLTGNYKLSKGVFISRDIISSKMACDNSLMREENWLKKVLLNKPNLTIMFIKNNQNISKDAIKLILSSKETPNNKKGKSIINFNLIETYGYADTPLGDDNSSKIVKSICNQLLKNKSSENQAQRLAEENSLIFRVYSRDGEDFPVTADYRVNRLNVKILNNQVIECSNG